MAGTVLAQVFALLTTIKGSIMKNKLIDQVIYILGFISIVIVWLTA